MSAVDMTALLKRANWRKKWPSGGFAIAVYIGLMFAVPHLGLPPLVSDVFVAPLCYLLPIGVGLLFLRLYERGGPVFMGRAQLLALSYFCGLFVITGLFVVRERHGILGSDPSVLFGACVLAAMGGFALQRRIFEPDASLRRFVKLYFLLAFPLFLFRYLVHFGLFSDFPLTDLTQAGHIMKGAVEFARFDVLNPFTADSYLPIRQVVSGLLVRFFHFDLLAAEWLYPFMAEIMRFTVVYSVVGVLTTTAWSRNLALATAMVFMGGFNSTNGELAVLGGLLLLSMLAEKRNISGPRAESPIFPLVIVLLGFGIARLLMQVDALIYVSIVITLALGASVIRARDAVAARTGAMLLLVFCLIPLHRSTVMFVPAMAGTVAVYGLLQFLHDRYKRAAAMPLKIAGVMLPLVAFGLAAVILVSALNGEDETFGLLPFHDRVMHVLLGTTIYTPDVMLGTGSKVALFELGQTLSPLLMSVTFGLFAAILVLSRHAARMSAEAKTGTSGIVRAETVPLPVQAMWCVTWLLVIFILSGFPFVHRLSYLPVVLFSAVFAELYAARMGANRQIGARPLILGMLFLATYMTACAFLAGFDADPALVSNDYIRRIQPATAALAAMLLLGMLMTVILAFAKRSLAIGLAAAIVVATLAWEKQISSAFYMRYAYGERIPDGVDAVSHYTRDELAVAESLKQEPPGTVLVSDPFLTSLLRARTGLNGIVTYSNLDTMIPSSKQRLQAVLRDLTDNETMKDAAGYCDAVTSMFATSNSAEFGYWLWRQRGPGNHRQIFLRDHGYSNSLVPRSPQSSVLSTIPLLSVDDVAVPDAFVKSGITFIVVLTEKTIRWIKAPAHSTLGYYPSFETLDAGLIAGLEKKFNATSIDDRIVMFRLDCMPAMFAPTFDGRVHGR